MNMRAPSLPLITVDPYFSVWSKDSVNKNHTVHWTGKSNDILGYVIIDGKKFRFLGRDYDYDIIEQKSGMTYAGFLDSRKRYTEMLLVWRNIIELESVSLPAKLSILESITSKRDFYRKNFPLVEPIITRLYQLYPTNGQVVDSYIAHLIAGNRIDEAATMLKQRIVDKTPTLEDIFRIIEIENNAKDCIMTFVREKEDSRVVAILNLSPYTIHADFNTGIYAGSYYNALTGEQTALPSHVEQEIAPWGYTILHK